MWFCLQQEMKGLHDQNGKVPQVKRVTDCDESHQPKRKRAAFGDITNVSIFLHKYFLCCNKYH